MTADGADIAEPDLDFLRADCDAFDRVEHLLMNRKLLEWLTQREVRANCLPGQGERADSPSHVDARAFVASNTCFSICTAGDPSDGPGVGLRSQ